jgi:hypothetical protein
VDGHGAGHRERAEEKMSSHFCCLPLSVSRHTASGQSALRIMLLVSTCSPGQGESVRRSGLEGRATAHEWSRRTRRKARPLMGQLTAPRRTPDCLAIRDRRMREGRALCMRRNLLRCVRGEASCPLLRRARGRRAPVFPRGEGQTRAGTERPQRRKVRVARVRAEELSSGARRSYPAKSSSSWQQVN